MSAHCIMHHESVNQLVNCSSSDSKNKRRDQLKKAQKTHFETVNFYVFTITTESVTKRARRRTRLETGLISICIRWLMC